MGYFKVLEGNQRKEIIVFELFLSKSIVNAENGVFLSLIFSTIPL